MPLPVDPISSTHPSSGAPPSLGTADRASPRPVVTPDSFAIGGGDAAVSTQPATPGAGSTVRLRGGQTGAMLPPLVGLGVNTIHRYEDKRVTPPLIAVTVFTPVPTDAAPGEVRDTNSKPFAERLPAVFVIGDSGHTRAFTGVDTRAGSPLAARLDAIIATMPGGGADPEQAIEWLRRNVNRLIRWTAGSSANDGRAEFAWDKAIRIKDSAWEAFRGVDRQEIGAPPVATGDSFPVVPFERYLEAGEGYCIQKALLSALILDRLGIPFRLINGAVSTGPGKTCGHTWLELADGRIFDGAWSTVEQPRRDHADHPDWYRIGGSYRFPNQRYPYLALG